MVAACVINDNSHRRVAWDNNPSSCPPGRKASCPWDPLSGCRHSPLAQQGESVESHPLFLLTHQGARVLGELSSCAAVIHPEREPAGIRPEYGHDSRRNW